MPKKYMKKKKVYRKRRAVPKNRLTVKPTRFYGFNRTSEQLLVMENPTFDATDWVTTTDHALVKTFVFSLGQLPEHEEFKNLFARYKLNMAILKMYPSYSQVASTSGAIVANNIIITVWANRNGVALTNTFTHEDLQQIQRKSQWMYPQHKPTTIKMRLNQLGNVYGGGVNVTDYGVRKPIYVATSEDTTPHYGMNVHIRKVDGTPFTTNSPRVLIKEKVYLTCKQVK